MTVRELIERLDNEDQDATVRLAYQPSWPLQSSFRGVIASSELQPDPEDPEAADFSSYKGSAAEVVWLVEGSQNRDGSPYAPRTVFEEAWA
jgi:hypothetical protein